MGIASTIKALMVVGSLILLVVFSSFSFIPLVNAAFFYDENHVMTSISEIESNSQLKLTADDSKLTRASIDYYYGNYDGELTQIEIDNFITESETQEMEKIETEYTFIDGRRGRIEEVSLEITCPLGDTDAPGDFVSLNRELMSWTLEEKNEHTYSRSGREDGNTVSFIVPSGWGITSVEGLSSKSISVDKRTVTGVAITDTPHVITFKKIELSIPPITPITVGQSVTISGSITPAYDDITITLTYGKPDGTTFSRTVMTAEDGSYLYNYTPEEAGSWEVKANWAGSESSLAFFNVAKLSSSMTCSASLDKINKGKPILVSGSISPPLASAIVDLTYEKPDGSTIIRTVTSSADGSFEYSYTPKELGIWKVTASWLGDEKHEGDTSSPVTFIVEESSILILALGAIVIVTVIAAVLFFVKKRSTKGEKW